jgi:hypothetical protein
MKVKAGSEMTLPLYGRQIRKQPLKIMREEDYKENYRDTFN